MKRAKSLVAFMFLVLLWVGVTGVEYDLAMHFRILSSFVGVCALSVLLAALLRAPEGYEDENGFHPGALAGAARS
jgi:hypothetical protein